MSDVQWWLAEVNEHGSARLVDGAHSTREGADRAAYLIPALGLAKPGVRYTVARVELLEPQPSSAGVNHAAIDTIDRSRRALRGR